MARLAADVASTLMAIVAAAAIALTVAWTAASAEDATMVAAAVRIALAVVEIDSVAICAASDDYSTD